MRHRFGDHIPRLILLELLSALKASVIPDVVRQENRSLFEHVQNQPRIAYIEESLEYEVN
jgi:hypothetical protein